MTSRSSIVLFILLLIGQALGADSTMRVYIGTYTGQKSQGIYTAQFDRATGRLGSPMLVAKTTNPTFLALHPNHRFLFAVNETSAFAGKPEGSLSAFAIEKETGKLTLLNQQPSAGSDPCHLAVTGNGHCVLTANYGSGSVASFAVQQDGRLSPPASVVQHQGSSVNPQRQAGPHAHFITPDPTGRFALACDLGLDKVLIYSLEPTFQLAAHSSASLKPGFGPRHLAFDPRGRFAYVINEIGAMLTVFSYNPRQGSLQELQNVPMLPEDFKGDNICAEVQVHPSGKFIYGSNRGHDSIAAFAVDPKTGRLSLIERQSTQGKTPRHFALDPTGRWLLAENQDSDSIVVFHVDTQTGRLRPAGQSLEIGAPVCLVFAGEP